MSERAFWCESERESLRVKELWYSSFARGFSPYPTITQPARWVTTTMPERFSSTISETINLPQGPQVYTQRILFHEIVPRKYRTNTSQNIPGAYISSHTYEYHYIVVHRCQPMEQSTT